MTTLGASVPDARLDPWMTAISGGDRVLFGYCLWHALLGGLSWCRSSRLLELDERLRMARTLSGRIYSLGSRIGVAALPDEESRIAHFLLTGPANRTSAHSWDADKLWLTARKVGRWTGRAVPPRGQVEELASYLRVTGAAYSAALAAAAARGRP